MQLSGNLRSFLRELQARVSGFTKWPGHHFRKRRGVLRWRDGSDPSRAIQDIMAARADVIGGEMTKIHRLAGTVDIDGLQYDWEVRSEPQWGETDGWKGVTVALMQREGSRGALLEFPPPKRLIKGLQRGRLQMSDATVSRGIRAALSAGWEPGSRGKSMVFMVDADGN